MPACFTFTRVFHRGILTGIVKSGSFLVESMTVLATGRTTHKPVTAGTVLMICPFQTQGIDVIGVFILFPQDGGGEWLGCVTTLAGNNRRGAAILVASGAVRIGYGSTGRVVMTDRAVTRNGHMQGVVERHLPV